MSSSAESPSRTGELLAGKYRLEARLGGGGMGEVYAATNEVIGRSVAIKMLRPEHATSAETVERFLREAKAANLVRHPHTVDVLDFGRDEVSGTTYLVQELLQGEDLSAYLERVGGRIGVSEAMEILLPVIDAIAVAHAVGVVHRDLKPGNIFLANVPGGKRVPKILDFGISKITALEGRIDISTFSVTLGTPAYMSPEQIQGDAVDARTDVWAIGVVLHQMLAGGLPFKGDSPGKQYVQICTADPIPLSTAVPDAPAALGRIVARCLSRRLEDRYPNGRALYADLVAFADQHGIDYRIERVAIDASGRVPRATVDSVPPASQIEARLDSSALPGTAIRGSGTWWVVAAVVALAIAGGAVVAMLSRETATPAVRADASRSASRAGSQGVDPRAARPSADRGSDSAVATAANGALAAVGSSSDAGAGTTGSTAATATTGASGATGSTGATATADASVLARHGSGESQAGTGHRRSHRDGGAPASGSGGAWNVMTRW